MDECEEYKAGFCTKSEFLIEGKTEPCNNKHVSSSVFNDKPIITYNQIIQEIDKKIDINLLFLELQSSSYQKMEVIDKIKDMIMKCDKISEMKRLIKAYGLCWIDANKEDVLSNDVCRICSAFMVKSEDCKHMFHNKYKSLRELRDKIQKENFNIK